MRGRWWGRSSSVSSIHCLTLLSKMLLLRLERGLKRRIKIVSNLMRGKGLVDLKPISWEVPAEIQWTQCCPKTCR